MPDPSHAGFLLGFSANDHGSFKLVSHGQNLLVLIQTSEITTHDYVRL